MNKKTVKDIDLKGKKVFVRCDFNVPMDENQNITDNTRIKAALPTIKYLLEQNCKIILASHLGRPKGEVKPEFSLKPVAKELSKLLGKDIIMANDVIGEDATSKAENLKEGEIMLLENVRFHREETDNDPEFAKKLASMAEIFVNDAFGTAHRAHASTTGIADYIPGVAGFLIEKELKRIGLLHSQLFKQEYIDKMLEKYRYKNLDEMYAAVGFGANSSVKVIARMLQEYRKEHEEENIEEKIQQLAKQKQNKPKVSNSGVIVKGIDNCLVKLSKCCNPLPGDEIIGYITKGRGVSVHRKDCVNIKDLITQENRLIDVEWYNENVATYQADIEIYSNDRGGLLVDILKQVGTTKAQILGVNTKTTKEKIAIIEITLEVENTEELDKAQKAIRRVESVYEVRRKK